MGCGGVHAACFLSLLALLMIRAQDSLDRSAAAGDTALIAFAAGGYLIGKLAGLAKLRALLTGLSLVALVGLFSTVMQMSQPEWNLIYPNRSASFPSGLFAHYNYSTAFGLGTGGLLVSAACREKRWLKLIFAMGAGCALVAIPLSLSRGGNLALGVMVALAGALVLARAFSSSKPIVSAWLPAVSLLALALIFATSLVPLIARQRGVEGFYTDHVRIDFWKAAAEITMTQPWLGGGPGSFTWGIFRVMDDLHTEPVMVHNESMQLAVDYGYPALAAIALLLAVPILLSFWQFINKRDTDYASLGAIGLVAMLVQSNFSFVFHTAPGAFIAALIIGRVSRSLWKPACRPSEAGKAGAPSDRQYRVAVLHHIKDFSEGKANALSGLISTLSQPGKKPWQTDSYCITYWSKVGNEAELLKAIADLKVRCEGELASLSLPHGVSTSPYQWRILRNVALGTCGLPTLYAGGVLCLALIQAWVPLYHPSRLTVSGRFNSLLSLVERNAGLGIDRTVLAAAREQIHQLETIEAREDWATSHRGRILRAVPGWRVDPGAALQLAEIVGWTGDFESALSYYDYAIEAQGGNESLFMAHAFKGQYLYEIFISSRVGGPAEQQKFFAQRAIDSFENANVAMKKTGSLFKGFALMLEECESFGRNEM